MMSQITTKVNDDILIAFRDTIYAKSRLRRGSIKYALEEAMKDYIIKYKNLEPEIISL